MEKRFAVGIDLGTTNSALALVPLEAGGRPETVPVPQHFSLQTIGEANLLPSALYLPLEAEAAAAVPLPWEASAQAGILGRFAREHGALLPDRLVTSAKSWLGAPHVDPRRPHLPWQSSLTERLLSPLEASRRYLAHLRQSLLAHLRQRDETAGLADCETVLTVPASFDEAARALTFEAATAAGWGEPVLLEEPQAAFYSWLSAAGESWRQAVRAGDLVLVCDVGGGTADFSLVAVTERQGELALERISVGEHILLGGDNMDLALAWRLRPELEKRESLDSRQFLSLVHLARLGKERLFADPQLQEFPVAIPGKGAGLLAGTLAAVLTREMLAGTILDGFFPRTPVDEPVRRQRGAGLREFGLQYAADPALSRHLAGFLARSWQNAASSAEWSARLASRRTEAGGTVFLRPTAVLFNGGVFKAEPLRRRMLELLNGWCGEEVCELPGTDLDQAVAQGAAAYGRLRATGTGIRIHAGTSRSYYLGLAAVMPAVPGLTPPLRGVCVVPQGMEEGSEAVLSDREFGLVTGEPAEFRFFSSTVRAGDRVGDLIEDSSLLEETAALEVTLPSPEESGGAVLPVRLHSILTEVGVLELWMQHEATGRRWKLEFNLREG